MATAATAQTAQTDQQPDPRNGNQIEEIIVTAQKRETTLQATPIAINAFSKKMLADRNIDEASRLTVQVPNLTLQTFQGNALISVRGIGSDSITTGGDPAVAFHVDGVYSARSTAPEGLFYDLQRIEVLRGPQGTLYGRNATAGSVNLITNPAVLNAASAEGDVMLGNYARRRLRGIINVPLVNDRIGLRISGVYDRHDGYLHNLNNPGNSPDDLDTYSIRGQLRFRINNDANLTLRTTISNRGGTGPSIKVTGPFRPIMVGPYTFPVDGAGPFGYGAHPNPDDPRQIYLNGNDSIHISTKAVTGTFEWTLPDEFAGGATFRLISGWQKQTYRYWHDSDATDATILYSRVGQASEQYSVEAQLVSPSGKPVEWIAGIYGFHENGADSAGVDYSPAPAALSIPSVPIQLDLALRSKSFATFGQATYKLADRLKFTAGLRYTRDEKAGINTTSIGGPISTMAETRVWNALTGKASVDFAATPENLFYLSFGRGYKAGGFAAGQPSFNPEKLNALEFGSKNFFLNRSVQVNAAVFYYDYRDLQVSFVGSGAGGAPVFLTENAANSKIYGAELEFSARPSKAFSVDGAVTYLHARYKDYVTIDPADPLLRSVSLDGAQIPNSPKFTAHLGLQYDASLHSAGRLTARVDGFYSSHVLLRSFDVHPYDDQPNYTRSSASLKWHTPADRYEVEIFVDNIENRNVKVRGDYVQIINQFRATYAPPRTIGIRFGTHF
ncbi:TonB-dependent receptor [Novosphingobium sp.]|uniref:TonB-dependent receptor n=1 Tax=Novosphingobium sp. TaxID=1874826 RepID=UPI003BAA15C2